MTPFRSHKSWNDGWNGMHKKTGLSFQKSFRERKLERKPSKTSIFPNKIKPFHWNGFYRQINMGWGGVYTPSHDRSVPSSFLRRERWNDFHGLEPLACATRFDTSSARLVSAIEAERARA